MTDGKHGLAPGAAEVAAKTPSTPAKPPTETSSGKAAAAKPPVVEEESAPKTETPENPKLPAEALRDMTTVFETPETPVAPPSSDVRDFTVERLGLGDWPDLHVSISPVDSHAPVWLGREPNSP